MRPANHQDVLDPIKLTVLAHTSEKLQVLVEGHTFVKAPCLLNARASYEECLHDVVLFPEEIVDLMQMGHTARPEHPVLKVDPLMSAVDNTQLRQLSGIRVENLNLPPQLRREPQIVVIEKRDKLAARGQNPCVARRRRPSPVVSYNMTNRPRKARQDFRVLLRVIRGVIDHEDLAVTVVLPNHAPERLGQKRRTISGRDDRRNPRHVSSSLRVSEVGHGRRAGR